VSVEDKLDVVNPKETKLGGIQGHHTLSAILKNSAENMEKKEEAHLVGKKRHQRKGGKES